MNDEDSSQLLVSTDYELPTPDSYGDDLDEEEILMQGGSSRSNRGIGNNNNKDSSRSNKATSSTTTTPQARWRRWSQQISQYCVSMTRSSSGGPARPDCLDYDYVPPNELARKRMPHKYDEKTDRTNVPPQR